MTSSDKTQGNVETKTKKVKAKLPWWVELLFVQIGLPEKLLRKLLKLKTKSGIHIETNKERYYALVIAFFGILYINPLIINAKSNNSCINETLRVIKSGTSTIKSKNISSLISAVNYCNGGNQLLSE